MSLFQFNSEEEKITAMDGKQYTEEELLRTNFLIVGGICHGGGIIKTMNGVNVEKMSLEEFLNVGKNPCKNKNND